MPTTGFDVGGGEGGPHGAPRPRRRARAALIVVLFVAAFGFGTLVAAGYEALSDLEARGVMDGAR